MCTVIETVTAREPLEEKEVGLCTVTDMLPVVTEEQKSQCLAQLTVSSYKSFILGAKQRVHRTL